MLTESIWQHIVERHLRKPDEPWVEWLLADAERVAAEMSPEAVQAVPGLSELWGLAARWRAGATPGQLRSRLVELARSDPLREGIIHILQQAMRESFEWPLVMVTVPVRMASPSATPDQPSTSDSPTAAVTPKGQPPTADYAAMHWKAVLPAGTLLVIRQVGRHPRVITCFFAAKRKSKPRHRWKSAVKKLLDRYVPIVKDAYGNLLGRFHPQQPVQYSTGRRLWVRCVTPENWGFHPNVQEGRWLGRLPEWPAVQRTCSAMRPPPSCRLRLRPRFRPQYPDDWEENSKPEPSNHLQPSA